MKLRSMILLVCLTLLGYAGIAAAVEGEPYQEIRVPVLTDQAIIDVLEVHPDLEIMQVGDGDFRILSRPSLTEKILAEGWDVEVIHEDLSTHYEAIQGGLRDYGVWHTFAETVAELNQLHADYPNITTAPFSIGQTEEGRDIWVIKISDNPELDEDEPELFIDGVHHAREIMAVELPLYIAGYLCENYGTDPFVTFLVENRELWILPMLNPDGFVYNETTNPNGGGMWRKNRRDNAGSSCYGVDPNRNYTVHWGEDHGSSGNPCDDTYRGPSAASEPEIQAVMNFIMGHDFVVSESVHSVVGAILIPPGYSTGHSPDHETFMSIGTERVSVNGYEVGTAYEVINYTVSGGSFDWAYEGEGIIAFSTEVGGSGFWPAQSERDGLLAENLYSFLYLIQVAGPTVSVIDLSVSGGNGNGKIEPGEAVDLIATVQNAGVLSDVTNLSISLTCDDPYIVLSDVSNTLGTLGAGESTSNALDPFAIQAEAGCPEGRLVTFTVIADADDGVHLEVPFVLEVGELPVITANDFEDAGEEWIQDGSHTATTGAFVRIDPVQTGYQPGDDTTPAPGIYGWITAQNSGGADGTDDVDAGISATRSPDFDLAAYEAVRLSMNYFHGQRDTGDDANDFFAIDVSSNGGTDWANLISHGDAGSQAIWRPLTVDLQDYIDITGQVRFRIQAADGDGGTGFGDIIEAGIDDFLLLDGGSANNPPSVPLLLSPPDGAPDVPGNVALIVGNAIDPEGDPLTYGFRVYADAGLTSLVASIDGVVEGPGTTSWSVNPPLDLGTYFWRAFAADPTQRGLFMAPASFTVTTTVGVDDFVLGSRPALTAEPNPAPEGVTIRYLVPSTLTSRLTVYDPQGRLVRKIETIPSATGWQEVLWDGRDDAGRSVSSGTYWVRLWTPEVTRTVRVVRID